ncbi:MAG: AAA family ATPase [Eggerthellaceae bacterium]|nr:AAA family ATPase [Eggerthellaceae bacterium]
MKVEHITIQEYRSIKDITLSIPKDAPLILFGPNNAGKSNILSAIDRLLGEHWPITIEMRDSDYFMRDSGKHPRATIAASFDEEIYKSKYGNSKTIGIEYWRPGFPGEETRFFQGDGDKVYGFGQAQRAQCQSYLIQANRNIDTALSYSSRYSLLSKFTHSIHAALTSEKKDDLDAAFKSIKETFETLPQYKDFAKSVQDIVRDSVKGFTHCLEVDLSAYDPNNYANALRIVAAEGGETRSFEEFGTGEQQVLLMAFAQAYLRVFGRGQGLVLIIEEPEAHLHPLAQRWLKKYIYDVCKSGVQVIISTHSADFLDPKNLEGLARVYKEDGVTKVKQVNTNELVRFCIETGVPENKISTATVSDFYASKVHPWQLRGMFAERALLVEGQTEAMALPVYFEKADYYLAAEGVDIVECGGKESIPLFWRLYEAFGYNCYCLFDADGSQASYDKHFKRLFGGATIDTEPGSFVCTERFAYFGSNWEKYFETTVEEYQATKDTLCQDTRIETSSKQALAYAYAIKASQTPDFIEPLIEVMRRLG